MDPAVDPVWQRLREIEAYWSAQLLHFGTEMYGKMAIIFAWEDFTLGMGDAMPDPDSVESNEFEGLFMPWFAFNWVPPRSELALPDLFLSFVAEEGIELEEDPFILNLIAGSHFSFYQVLESDAEKKRVVLRDVFLDREYIIKERKGSETLRAGQLIYARVVSLPNSLLLEDSSVREGEETAGITSIMIGSSGYAIPPSCLPELTEVRRKVQKRRKRLQAQHLIENEELLRDLYFQIRDEMLEPSLPKVSNTDGEELVNTRVIYDLSCTPEEAMRLLQPLFGYSYSEMLEDAEKDGAGKVKKAEFPWLKHVGRPDPEKGNTVLGHFTMTPGTLEVRVNSQERAHRIRSEIENRLGRQAKFKAALIESMDALLNEMRKRQEQDSGVADLEVQKMREVQEGLLKDPGLRTWVERMGERHWNDWLDHPLPALKGMTPRHAAQDPQGRELLEAVLLDFELRSDRPSGAAHLMKTDVSRLREILGMQKKKFLDR